MVVIERFHIQVCRFLQLKQTIGLFVYILTSCMELFRIKQLKIKIKIKEHKTLLWGREYMNTSHEKKQNKQNNCGGRMRGGRALM